MKANIPLNWDANTSALIIRLCINKIRNILMDFPNEHCRQMLNEAERRYNNPELKLAIIGEFNTGKSTFINALLKRDFLSTDNIPTTVIPTYIRWDGANNTKPGIRINLINDKKRYTISENRVFLEERLGLSLNRDDDLERITTNNDLIGVVSHVAVSFPMDERFKNFCLIDTPGANPGAEETREHANITRDILRKEADTTIILFPALVVGNRSALEFISENASHLLDGASFVITKTDMLNSEKELKKISDYLKGLVKQKYGLEDQTIYTCSAMKALQAYSGNETTDSYLVQFEEMLTEMFENIAQKRKKIIFNKLSSLIKIILGDLRKEQSELTEKLKEDMKILKKYSLDNLSGEYKELFDEFKTSLDDIYSEKKYDVISWVSNKRRDAYNLIETDIDSVKGLGELSEYASKGIKTRLNYYENSIKSGIKADIDGLKTIYKNFSETLFARLKEYQLKISSEIAKGEYSVNKDISANMSMDVSVNGMLGSLGIGALIMFFVNPLALVGVLAVGWLFSEALLNKMKKNLKNKVKAGLEQSDGTIVDKWKDTLITVRNQYISYGNQLMSDYKKKYKKIFDARIASDAQEKERIEKELSKLQNILKDINVIEAAVNKCSEISLYNENEMYLIVKSLQGDGVYSPISSEANKSSYFDEPFNEVLKMANAGKASSQWLVGLEYEDRGDYKEAFKWHKKAAEQGDALAQSSLGDLYFEGKGVSKSYSDAFKWYQKAAEQGQMRAQCNVGVCYNIGAGVEQNYEEGYKWCRKAAEQGYGKAQGVLGLAYEAGRGVTRDPEKAFYWYEKAAEQGIARAQYFLGKMYECGKGVSKNPEKSRYWYEKAAEQGDKDAINKIS